MLNLNSIIIGAEDAKTLAAFYEKVLEKAPKMNEGGYVGFEAGACYMTIGPHDKVRGMASNPERIMFNFATSDVRGEFDRIKKLGAKVVAEPYQMGEDMGSMWIATLADPEGNYFQLMSPWET